MRVCTVINDKYKDILVHIYTLFNNFLTKDTRFKKCILRFFFVMELCILKIFTIYFENIL